MGHHVKTEFVKTRKLYTCWGCRGEIPKGDEVEKTTCVDMGQIFSTYTCDICREVVSHWDDQDREGISEGDVKYGNEEDWEDAKRLIEEGE